MGNVRRRGAELESAIYEVVRKIVDKEGVEGLTFQKVAELAGTSKSVIYRRWETPLELAISAFQARIKLENNGSVDKLVLTGKNLQDDLFQLMDRFLISIDALGEPFLRSVLVEIGTQPNATVLQLMERNSEIDLRAINRILDRARARGEQVKADISNDVKLLPFEWLRYKMFLRKNISTDMIETLINEILLPVYLESR
ncbi:TetR/AcrR family transcriptional regulator [Liquorilactobacillus hordei]|uniref:TetR family transcriptional regulator n=1 Tax=Liquorilactobacillus hordei TaxID=468911 RepID=A0A3Q8C9I5_9LACO|nr:TetR family transcriptional regulator [Liquorilactobacillus hordei]AUJ29729.1 TetR family transcriptional regulator [Liquorilactobacillus hordei]MBZ2405008.1 TetR family transcriptional regulator [Liquorilactobacillus hordei]